MNINKYIYSIVKNFPMTNYDILMYNKQLLGEILKPEINVEVEGTISFKVNYDYVETISMLSYDNRKFYEKNLIIKGKLIYDKDTNEYFILYVDPMIFYENSPVKYDAVFNLIRRKNSKDVIIYALFEMIKSNYSIKILKLIFNKIVKQLHKNFYNNKKLFRGSSVMITDGLGTNDNDSNKKNSYELINPQLLLLIRRRTVIKQQDVYYNLFRPFEYKQNCDLEYVFKLLVHFINMLLFSGIPLQPSFQYVVVNYLRKVKNFSLVSILFQYHSLPDNFELAKYLVDECQVLNKEIEDENELRNNEEFRKNTFQYGLDMLIRLKKFEEAFMAMINKGMFAESLLFLKRYNVQINFLSEETVKRLTILIKENKNLVCEYLMY